MLQGIVAAHGRCGHCGKLRWVASIPELATDVPYMSEPEGAVIQLCAGCIYKLTRLAALLVKLEAAPRRKGPRRPAKAAKRAAPEPSSNPDEHAYRVLSPENRLRMP